MPDLRVVHLRRILPVSRVLDSPGPPHQLYVTGPEASEVAEVEINGARGYPWKIVSKRTIAIELPLEFLVRNIAVLSREMGDAREAEVFLGFTRNITVTRGIESLVQYWLKCFLSTPGSDPFSKSWGGGANDIIKKSFAQEGNLNSTSAVSVQRTNRLVVARQSTDMSIPRNERLAEAKLVSTRLSPDRTTFYLEINMTNQTGEQVRVGLS